MRDKKNRLRVAIYMRVAQKEQCEEAVTAMKSQEAVLEQITQNSGNVIVGRFEDYGSGIDYRRPGLCAALEMVKSGQADALLMKNENRLGRNVSENLRLVAALRKTGRRIFFAANLIWYRVNERGVPASLGPQIYFWSLVNTGGLQCLG